MIEKLSCIVNPRSSPSSTVAAMSTKLGRWLHRSRKTRHGPRQALVTEPHSQQEGCRTEEGSNSLSRDRTSGSQMGGFVQHGLMYAFASQVLSYLFSAPSPLPRRHFLCYHRVRCDQFLPTKSLPLPQAARGCLSSGTCMSDCPRPPCRDLSVTQRPIPLRSFTILARHLAPLIQLPVPFSQNSRQSHLAVACNPAAVSRRAQGCGDKAILLV